jgi:hypothetical protein
MHLQLHDLAPLLNHAKLYNRPTDSSSQLPTRAINLSEMSSLALINLAHSRAAEAAGETPNRFDWSQNIVQRLTRAQAAKITVQIDSNGVHSRASLINSSDIKEGVDVTRRTVGNR